jgi:Integrase core domain
LRHAGWAINDKRVERIWRREGLKVPDKQPKRGRLWLTDGRLRPQRRNHVWSYDLVEDRTHDRRRYRMLNVLGEFTHECLAIRIARKLKAIDVIDVLSDLFILRGIPGHIRSDNGPEFVAAAVQKTNQPKSRPRNVLSRTAVTPSGNESLEIGTQMFKGFGRDRFPKRSEGYWRPCQKFW